MGERYGKMYFISVELEENYRKNWFKALFMAMMLVSFTSIMRAGAQREEPPLFRRLLPDIDPEDLSHLRSMLAT